MLVLLLGETDRRATARRLRGIHDARIAVTRGVTLAFYSPGT